MRSNVNHVESGGGGGAQALETKGREAEERVRGLQAKKTAEYGGGERAAKGGGGDGFDCGTGGGGGAGEVEALQRELSGTLTDLAKVSTEVRTT